MGKPRTGLFHWRSVWHTAAPVSERVESNGDYERERELMERDDRGVFGPEGLKLSAAMRRKYQTVLEPANMRAQMLLRSGEEKNMEEAERILRASLPRDEVDLRDERYFGIYWGLAEIAMQRSDKIAALDWFQQAIVQFPAAVRKNHLRRLVALGVQLSQWTNGSGDIVLSETDAAAILSRIQETIRRWTTAGAAPLEEMELHAAGSRLEVRSPLGRWAAARKHRR